LDRDAQPPGRPPDQRQVAVRFSGRRQQPPGLGRQDVQLPAEALLDPIRQRLGVPVAEIITSGGTATGAQLADGTRSACRQVGAAVAGPDHYA
jgi:hypothetical protein